MDLQQVVMKDSKDVKVLTLAASFFGVWWCRGVNDSLESADLERSCHAKFRSSARLR